MITAEVDSTQPSRVSGITIGSVSGCGSYIVKSLSAPLSSKPTPTPSMEASIRKANGLAGFNLVIDSVDTKEQFCKAAEFFCSFTRGVPITHRPLPGGVHFRFHRRSNASFAEACALASFQGRRLDFAWSFCREYMPLMTRSHTSTQVSLVPSSFNREYVRRKVISPTLFPAASL